MKTGIDALTAIAAIVAAVLWIKSARVEVWADGQTQPKATNLVIVENGRLYDVTASAKLQAEWSGWAAYAAAVAAALQSLGVIGQLARWWP